MAPGEEVLLRGHREPITLAGMKTWTPFGLAAACVTHTSSATGNVMIESRQ